MHLLHHAAMRLYHLFFRGVFIKAQNFQGPGLRHVADRRRPRLLACRAVTALPPALMLPVQLGEQQVV